MVLFVVFRVKLITLSVIQLETEAKNGPQVEPDEIDSILTPEQSAVLARGKTTQNMQVYRDLFPLTLCAVKQEQPSLSLAEQNRIASVYAIKLALLFGSYKKAVKYLKQCERILSTQTNIVDVACSFSLPTQTWDLTLWQRIIAKHAPNKPGDQILHIFSRADKITEKLNNNARLPSLAELRGYIASLHFTRGNEDFNAAQLFFEYQIPENGFNLYLDIKSATEVAGEHIPDVQLSGADIHADYADYSIRKLPATDPRAAILGKLTGCCQFLGDPHGSSVTRYGLTSPNAGFYVLCKHSKMQDGTVKEDIVAQALAWRGMQEGVLVFDSIETNFNFRSHQTLVTDIFQYLASHLIKEHQINRVLVGTGSNTPADFGMPWLGVAKLRVCDSSGYYSGGGFHDASTQRLLADQSLTFVAERYRTNHPDTRLAELTPQAEAEQTLLAYQALLLQIYREAFDWYTTNEKSYSWYRFFDQYSSVLANFYALYLAPADPHAYHKGWARYSQEFQSYVADCRYDVDLLFHSLLNNDLIPIDTPINAQGQTPLHFFMGNRLPFDRQLDAVIDHYFIKRRSGDLNVQDNAGYTPLYLAVVHGNKEAVALLLAHGADMQLIPQGKDSLLHAALTLKNDFSNNRDAILNALIVHGVNVNEQDKHGRNALNRIATEQIEIKPDTLFYLIENTIEPELKSVQQILSRMPLFETSDLLCLAIEKGYLQTAQQLLAGDAKLFDDKQKVNALHAAIKIGHLPLIDQLIDAGTSLDAEVGASYDERRFFVKAKKSSLDIALDTENQELVKHIAQKRFEQQLPPHRRALSKIVEKGWAEMALYFTEELNYRQVEKDSRASPQK